MKKSKALMLAALCGAGLAAASAVLQRNYNALAHPPVMADGLQKPDRRQAPARAPEAGTPLPAIVASVYDYASGSEAMYRLPDLSGGEMTKVADVSSYYGGALNGNLFYACHDGRFVDYWDTDSDPHGHKIQAYDIETWQPSGSEIYLEDYRASDLAIDPATGLGYAYCDYGSMMYRLYEIDLAAGTEKNLMGGTSMFSGVGKALAFDSEGRLWGVTKEGKLGVIDRSTGLNDERFDLGISGADNQHGWTASFDPDSGYLIFICNLASGSSHVSTVYQVDINTGAKTALAEFPGKCITSMFITSVPVEDKAPGEPTDLTAAFEGGSLSGTVSFKMPAALHDGSAASGTATWTVSEGDTQLGTGTAAYGADVNADVTLGAGGKKTITVKASNETGAGKAARLSLWAGPDYPKSPEGVKVVYDEAAGKFTVSWEAVTEGVNGGFIDPALITYDVTRLPAGVKVAEGISALTYTDTYAPEDIESVSYEIVARNGQMDSQGTVSDPTVTGALALPYSMYDAEYNHRLDYWTVIDVNEDGSTWSSDSYNGVYYSYNSSNAADDWAITPPIAGVAGYKYHVSMKLAAYGWSAPASDVERIEVKTGDAPTAAAMTVTVLEPTLIDRIKSDPLKVEFDIVPEKDGKFFMGLHAISDANRWRLMVTDLTIAAGVSNEAPAPVTGLRVTADRTGALTASGILTAPATSQSGAPIESVTKIEVFRGTESVAVIDNPAPGAECIFEDTEVPEAGEYTYTAYAYNGSNKSAPGEEFKTYVGINTPSGVPAPQIEETAVAGQVKVSWQPAVTDSYGYPLNGDVTYSVEVYPDNAYYHGNETYEGIEGTEFTLTPKFDGGRDHGMVFVKVRASNSKGTGYAERTLNIPVGRALELPFAESFPNYTLEHPWGDGQSNGPQIGSISDDERSLSLSQYNGWNRMMDRSFNSADGAQDGDNGFAGMFGWSYVEDAEGNYHDEWTELLSPKISLAGAVRPILTFYTFNWLNSNGPDNNRLSVEVVADGARHTVKDFSIKELGNVQAWELVSVDLSEFAGKDISLIFKGTIQSRDDRGYNWVLLDNIRIGEVDDYDLAVDGASAPVMAAPGEEFTVSARITNNGALDVAAHTAYLLHNGAEVMAKNLGSLRAGTSEVVEFTQSLSVNDPVGNVYLIKVDGPEESNTANNSSAPVTVGRNLLLLPEPQQAIHDREEGVVVWQKPDLTAAAPAPFTDDFEEYGNFYEDMTFVTEAGDWVFVDRDGAKIGGMVSASTQELLDFPGIPSRSAQSWWVQNRFADGFNSSYDAHSGAQYLANMYVTDDAFTKAVQQDDWAISPELCGGEQMISLMAKSYNRESPESLEFLYSTGSVDPDDFVSVRTVEAVSGDWTQYIFVVPEGARRFAIRGTSLAVGGTAQTFVDDVTFVPASDEPWAVTLLGYNLYRDDVKLNSEPLTELRFTLPDAAEHRYAVSALYAEGESRAVEAVAGAGIGSLRTGVSVRAEGRNIVIEGLDGASFAISAVNGIVLRQGQASGTVTEPVAQGVYIVRAAGRIHKLIVR